MTIYWRPSPKLLRHPGQFLLQPQIPSWWFPRKKNPKKGDPKKGIPPPVGPSGFGMGITGMEGIKTLRIFPKEKNSSPNSPAKHTSEKSAFRIYFLINLKPKSVKADFILGKGVLEEFPSSGISGAELRVPRPFSVPIFSPISQSSQGWSNIFTFISQ